MRILCLRFLPCTSSECLDWTQITGMRREDATKKTPTDPMPMGAIHEENWYEWVRQLTPLINSCKPDAKKKWTPTSVIDGGPKNQPGGWTLCPPQPVVLLMQTRCQGKESPHWPVQHPRSVRAKGWIGYVLPQHTLPAGHLTIGAGWLNRKKPPVTAALSCWGLKPMAGPQKPCRGAPRSK